MSQIHIEFNRTNYGKFSIIYRGAVVRNSLPSEIRNITSASPAVSDSKSGKTPPNIHHARVEAFDGPCFNQKQRYVRRGVSLFGSKSQLCAFFWGGQVWDKS